MATAVTETEANKVGQSCQCGKFPRLGSSMDLCLADGSKHSQDICELPKDLEEDNDSID